SSALSKGDRLGRRGHRPRCAPAAIGRLGVRSPATMPGQRFDCLYANELFVCERHQGWSGRGAGARMRRVAGVDVGGTFTDLPLPEAGAPRGLAPPAPIPPPPPPPTPPPL